MSILHRQPGRSLWPPARRPRHRSGDRAVDDPPGDPGNGLCRLADRKRIQSGGNRRRIGKIDDQRDPERGVDRSCGFEGGHSALPRTSLSVEEFAKIPIGRVEDTVVQWRQLEVPHHYHCLASRANG